MPGELDLPPEAPGVAAPDLGGERAANGAETLVTVETPLYRIVFSNRGAVARSIQLLEYESFTRDGPAQLVPEGGEVLAGLWRYRIDGDPADLTRYPHTVTPAGRDPDWRGGWSADADLPLRSSGRPFFQRDQIHLFGGFVHRGGQWRTAGYRPRRAFPQARTGAGVQRTEGTGRAADAGRLRKQRRRRHQVSSSGADPGARRDGTVRCAGPRSRASTSSR